MSSQVPCKSRGQHLYSFLVFIVCLSGPNGIQLWGSATDSNLEILERFRSKVLWIITDAPRYVANAVIKLGLQVLSVRQEVRETVVSPTDEGSRIIPTAWHNLYSKDQITIVGLSDIIPQI